MGNANEMPVFFNMIVNFMVEQKGTKSVTVKTTENEKFQETIMPAALANRRKLLPYII